MSSLRKPVLQEEPWTLAEFLEILPEMPEGERWELIDGRIYKMRVGGTTRHRRIVANGAFMLRQALRRKGSRCDVFSEGARLETENTTFFPDVVVTCEKQDPEALAIHAPVMILEVLSRTTRDKDETLKLAHYRRIPSLQHYAIADQTTRLIRVTTREADGTWSWAVLEDKGAVTLSALDVSIPLEDLYDGVFDEG